MPKAIPLPQTGCFEPIAVNEVDDAIKLAAAWTEQYHNWASLNRFVVHGDPNKKPQVPISPEILPEQAGLLSRFDGKYTIINVSEV